MTTLELTQKKNVRALLVALANGEVRLYNGKYLISSLQVDDPVVWNTSSLLFTRVCNCVVPYLLYVFPSSPAHSPQVGMRFGSYAREECTLILVHRRGALSMKVLTRNANLEATDVTPGPPPEQVCLGGGST